MRVLFAILRYLKKYLSNIQYFFTVQVLTVDYISVKTAAVVQHSSASWLSDSRPASPHPAQPAQPTQPVAGAHPVPPVPVDLPASLSHFRPAMLAVWAVHTTAATEVKGKATLCFSKTSPQCLFLSISVWFLVNYFNMKFCFNKT